MRGLLIVFRRIQAPMNRYKNDEKFHEINSGTFLIWDRP
jgi:hypothetical protein